MKKAFFCIIKIFGYKNIRLNLKSDVFGVSIFSRVCVGEKVILRGRTLGPKLGA